VILRVDHKAGPLLAGDVSSPDNVGKLGGMPEQQPAALGRRRFPRVRHDRVKRRATDLHS
jgi:hypothetical protein